MNALAAALIVLIGAPASASRQAAEPAKSAAASTSPATRLLAEGVELLRTKRIADATARFEAAARQDPKLPEAHYYLGVVREQAPDLPAAASEYRLALALAPSMAEAHDGLGFVLGRQGHTDEAIAEFERAVSLQPALFDAQSPPRRHALVDQAPRPRSAGARGGRHAEPVHPEAHYYLGLTLRQLGNLDGAIAELRESIRLNPRIAKAHAYLGVALRETGDLDAAVTSLREALRIDPAEDDAANALGLVYMQRGDADAAVATFKALVERAPATAPRGTTWAPR